MKKFKGLNQILVAAVVFMLLSIPLKVQSQNALDVFPKDALPVVNEIIAYYDSIVRAANPDIKDIREAYLVYLDTVCPKILHDGNFAHSGINPEARRKLFDRLDKKGLSEIFIVGDTLKYFDTKERKRVVRYFPYYVNLNMRGAYVRMLEKLSHSSTFMNEYYKQVHGYRNPTAGSYGMILRDYRKLNFSDPAQRLVFIVTILSVNEKIENRFRH
jgi:hypothetical protein